MKIEFKLPSNIEGEMELFFKRNPRFSFTDLVNAALKTFFIRYHRGQIHQRVAGYRYKKHSVNLTDEIAGCIQFDPDFFPDNIDIYSETVVFAIFDFLRNTPPLSFFIRPLPPQVDPEKFADDFYKENEGLMNDLAEID